MNYKVSKNFDMDISFEDLIKYNRTCKVDLNSNHHFETYDGILIYVSHPKSNEKFSIELGIDEDGIMYEGDGGCIDSFKEIPIGEGLDLLTKYGNLHQARFELESILVKNKLDRDVVKLTIS